MNTPNFLTPERQLEEVISATSLISLKIVPNWLTVTVVSRDILIIVGIMVFFFTSHKVVPSLALPANLPLAFSFLLFSVSY